MRYPTIPIRAAAASPVCETPRLAGEPGQIQGLLAALEPAICAVLGARVPAGTWLRELRVDADEAVVMLAPELRRPELVQVAFETLRALLRDTDIYVDAARR
jgi:hypothetical protein